MSSNFFLQAPIPHRIEERPAIEVPPADPSPPAATPEQLRAVDEAFAHYEEHSSVADLYWVYAGMMLLGDLARDHLRHPDIEDETEEKDEEESA